MPRRLLLVLLWVPALLAPGPVAPQTFATHLFRGGYEDAVCANGLIEDAETCDDGAVAPDDGCSERCAVEFGHYCDGRPSVCVTICSDGFRASSEACDDGNKAAGDGCNASCMVETGFSCTGTPSICATRCGDGVVAGGETCDDGNPNPGDGCSASCAVESGFFCAGEPSACATTCGDGIVAGGETCDDANPNSGDGCNASCAVETGFSCTGMPSVCAATCGDGIVAGTETCDDANPNPGDGCSASCAVEPGFFCAGTPSVCSTTCGDGITAGVEACDDGDMDETDGCTTQCVVGRVCTASALPGADRFSVEPANGRCYAAFDDEMTTFAAANLACTTAGGFLATLTSPAEAARVDGVRHPGQNPWIGASEGSTSTVDDAFAWVTGELFAYRRFASGEPDDDVGSGGGGDCLHIANAAGEWADTRCDVATFVAGRVCEFEP